MKNLTDKEAFAMRGITFKYIDDYGNSGVVYIAEVDLKIGLTCKVYSAGHDKKEGHDMVCLSIERGDFKKIQTLLKEVKTTGKYKNKSDKKFFGIMSDCVFD